MPKCGLCGESKVVTKHHLIPKSVVRSVNPKSKLKDMIVKLCEDCHSQVHFSFLNHMIMMAKVDGYDRKDAIKFQILKGYLRGMHPKAYKDWGRYWKDFLNDAMKEFDEEDEQQS